LLDKPSGVTSARAVSKVKRLLPKKTRVGHTGTLDPLASGLLVLLLGRATRLSRYVLGMDKTYTATARFGATSDTLDADGDITPLDAPMPDEGSLRAATRRFTGDLLQTPPMASAVKVGGERLYSLHRRGLTVDRQSRRISVHAFELLYCDTENETATFRITCGSGTYVRALISDLASSLGTGAYLTALRRNSVGHFDLSTAVAPDDLTAANIRNHIIQPRQVVSGLPALEVGEELRRRICNGGKLRPCELEGAFVVECGGELLAVYRGDGAGARAEVVLCGG